ncbi:protein of unknown function DUF2914 [Geobacter metallireducens GS-15]|uniref:DUF2914 domain-containing protein n=2 Tax=Geobacteraceae TaxID=213422 RepID=Q39X29_GEOMG|nr:protein of unknown function DUF2914 [Geobacter metallireducens GS-15]MBT1076611.1 DUF2914 domain-containing protein [Geobacter grbiciae]
MRKLFAFLTAFWLCLPGATASMAAEGGSLRITEMAVTTKVSRNNPIDAVRRINHRSVPALYCFTRIVNPSGEETPIRHVWYRNGEVVGEQELQVKGQKWRTWSKRPIDRDSIGTWRVEALDSAGKLLKAVEFRIN